MFLEGKTVEETSESMRRGWGPMSNVGNSLGGVPIVPNGAVSMNKPLINCIQ